MFVSKEFSTHPAYPRIWLKQEKCITDFKIFFCALDRIIFQLWPTILFCCEDFFSPFRGIKKETISKLKFKVGFFKISHW